MGIIIDLKTIAPLMALVLIGLLVYMRKRQQRSIGYLFCFSIIYVYLLYVVKYTVFPLRLFAPLYTKLMMKQGATWLSAVNLVPFRGVSVGYLLSVQGIGNILLTVPLGFGLPFLTAADLSSSIRRGILFPIAIEFVQFLIDVAYGFPVRTVDVNDVLFNFVGVLIGYGLFRLLAWFYRKTVSPTAPVRGAWNHIHAVLMQ